MSGLVTTVLCTMLALAGAVIVAAAATGSIPERRGRALSTGLWTKVVHKARAMPRRRYLAVGVGVGGGVVAGWLTGWPTLVLIVPAAAVGLPWLLREPPGDDIKLLEALDRWVRAMIGTMSTGKSITDAIRLSARQAPLLLAPQISQLVRRLDDRWTPEQALLAMADDLASPDADAVLAALMLSAQRGGSGASATLHALADSIQDRLRALREIEAERAKPRAVVRQVTSITVVVLGLGFLTAREFFAPYGTPIGQVLLVALLALYLAALLFLRRMTVPRRRERILRSAS